ncbi:MAG: amidohydrolase family protein [Lachnospiraceae bacterium]|nr:amidohydrolase family protein [Lachnospiraceae bacterium]
MRKRAYINGQILTMDRIRPRAEAVLVSGKRIQWVGSRADMGSLLHRGVQVVDLEGRTMLPGFIHGSSHLMSLAYNNMFGNASPGPGGVCNSPKELVRELTRQIEQRGIKPGIWFVAMGYAPERYPLGQGPTLEELDEISRERPVCLVHASGQYGAFNSMGLAVAGIGRFTPDPFGGQIERSSGTRMPTGILRGRAFLQAVESIKLPSLKEALWGVKEAVRLFASQGITTLKEARTEAGEYALLHLASLLGILRLDVIFGPESSGAFGKPLSFSEGLCYRRHCRLGGCSGAWDECSCGEREATLLGDREPNMLFLVEQAVRNQAEGGPISQEKQRIFVEEALRAVTIHGAIQILEERKKGSISEGKLADLVILDGNPLTSPVEGLRDIHVLETIKEGKSIFRRLAGQDKEG